MNIALDHRRTVDLTVSFVVATVLTGASYVAGLAYGWIDDISWLEAFAVFTSYSCTYLCVRQSRLNYPIGAISTVALSVLFWQQGLYSSAALNAYLAPALAYGWWRWGDDRDTRPVSRLAFDWWLLAYAGMTGGTYVALRLISDALGAALAPLDSAILVLSILAQLLLDNKKIETWAVWAIVNVIAIWTYWEAGLVVVALQFVFFLANTIYGWASWQWSARHG